MKQVKDVDAPGAIIHQIDKPEGLIPGGISLAPAARVESRDAAGRLCVSLNGAPAETVKLSVSVAKVLVEKTPLHAWQKHRLLGGGKQSETDATTDGKIFESILFNRAQKIVTTCDFPTFQSAAAKEAKALALAAGKIPVLLKDWPYYADAGMAMLQQIQAAGINLNEGQEQAELVWTSDGVECKGVPDQLTLNPDSYIIRDVKAVADASEEQLARSFVDYGWDMQDVAYTEGVETLYPHLAGRGFFEFIFCEKAAPYAVRLVRSSATMKEHGKRRWARAKRLWQPCVTSNTWPGYTNIRLDALPWQLAKVETADMIEGVES